MLYNKSIKLSEDVMNRDNKTGCAGCLTPVLLFLAAIILCIIVVFISHPEILDIQDIPEDTTDVENDVPEEEVDPLLCYNQQ